MCGAGRLLCAAAPEAVGPGQIYREEGRKGEEKGQLVGGGGGAGLACSQGPALAGRINGPSSVRVKGRSWPRRLPPGLGLWNALFIYGSVEA